MKETFFFCGLIAMFLLAPDLFAGNNDSDAGIRVNSDMDVVFLEEFDQSDGEVLPDGWWVEGGEEVFVEDGHLRLKADPIGTKKLGKVCTVWYEQNFSGNLKVEFDAHVVASEINANNINFFFMYSDPNGTPLKETRQFRLNADYKLYHDLNGYIFTFLNASRNEHESKQARMRMRRCPGFELMTEVYGYHCRKNTTYHITITKVGSQLRFAVDDIVYLEAEDSQAWDKGLIGLRTFQTDLWWDNIKVTQLK